MNRVEHVVFLRLANLETSQWTKLKTRFMSMKASIPGIVDLSIGKNISPDRAEGYTYALRVLFESENDLRVYADHPEHVKFKEMLVFQEAKEGLPKSRTICIDWTTTTN